MYNPFMSGLGMFGGYGGYRPPMPPMMGGMFGSPFGGMMGGYQRPSFGRPPMMGGFGGFGGYGSPFGGLGMFGMSPYGGMPNYGMFGGMMNPFMNTPLQQSPDAQSVGIINDGGGALLSATEGVSPAPGAPVNNRLPQFNYGKEHAKMRMMQRDVKSPEEAAYISKVLGTDTPTDQGVNAIPTDLMAGFRSSEFALPPNAMTDQAMGSVGLADGRNFRFGSLAETGAFRNYLDSIGQEYNKNTGMSMFNIPPAIPGLPSIFR